MYYYATKETIKFLADKRQKRVFLFGGNTGHSNYGDVIQLKNEIKFHTEVTERVPVVFLRLEDPLGGSAHEQNRIWYGVKHFVYTMPEDLGNKTAGLHKVREIAPGSPLHIYGGGYLNGFWGKDILGVIKNILQDFSVGSYVFSGQQISKEVVPDLKGLFDFKLPALLGVRDKMTYNLLRKELPGLESRFSFDDVTEILKEWARDGRKATSRRKKQSIAWHFNTTHYTAGSLSGVKDRVEAVQKKYPDYNHVIIQAFDDKDAKDSLQTISSMESDFPLMHYRVVDVSQMALEMKIGNGRHAYPDLAGQLADVGLAIVSSYHAAMTMSYFGIPVFLVAANDFYLQKQKGLGYSSNMKKFLRHPEINLKSFDDERLARKDWLRELRDVFNQLD